MIRLLPLVLAASIAFVASPAWAQEPQFTPEDAAFMDHCVGLARIGVQAPGLPAKTDSPAAPPRGADTPQRLQDCIGAASGPCMESPDGGTTMGMVDCLARETAWWDQLLNANYGTLRSDMEGEAFTALRDAQRAWIAFRDAECAFRYTFWREGTIRSLFYGSCRLDLTARRAIDLEDVANWAL